MKIEKGEIMEFNECLFSRRSIRNFSNKKISNETIKDIINAGIYAPSACNFEAWKFIIIDENNKEKDRLENPLIKNAPYGIIVTYRNDLFVTGRKYKDYYQSSAAAIQNMLLYINSIGLGAVWICGLPKAKKIKKAFNIPKNFDIIACIAFGYPLKGNENSIKAINYHYGNERDFKQHKRRYTLEQVMCSNTFTTIEGDCTYAKYPKRKTLIKQLYKNKFRKIKRKLRILLKLDTNLE